MVDAPCRPGPSRAHHPTPSDAAPRPLPAAAPDRDPAPERGDGGTRRSAPSPAARPPAKGGAWRLQLALALAGVALPVLAYLLSADVRAEVAAFADLIGRGDAAAVGARVRAYGPWAPLVSLLLMVGQALAAPFPHFLIVFANGLAFGVWWGWLLSLAGQTLAAAVCFWLARALGRAPVEALVGRFGLEAADRWFARWGTAGVFATRLMPGVGFDAVSYAAGLTGMRFGPFLLATVLGSAPQALLYVYLGRYAPGSAWLLLGASGALALAALGLGWWRRRAAGHPAPDRARRRSEAAPCPAARARPPLPTLAPRRD